MLFSLPQREPIAYQIILFGPSNKPIDIRPLTQNPKISSTRNTNSFQFALFKNPEALAHRDNPCFLFKRNTKRRLRAHLRIAYPHHYFFQMSKKH
ncbi:uncharacterized protein LACBIDRAFT_314974 [Laccaria bicolor S238N-H82]|uniref:Predicted protein n=1 Tax=Laccaria bicolor (strain S238N-H82 / ATCC MYA-4686) TaxID=486041 RepID=B0DZN4_LACBS|nr:uncharacterized protein LACBIDRAFT_314974 [Laccaria bicolor S238N-H82]EDQ99973.1 predicted protein [Laccaria bicolor S238N-H82]|eukprot:XP_001889384.1 predicted protein [Laccaria bicolor S238N-H82]